MNQLGSTTHPRTRPGPGGERPQVRTGLFRVFAAVWFGAYVSVPGGAAGRAAFVGSVLAQTDALRTALSRARGRDAWTVWVETGDRRSGERSATKSPEPTARAAYLLAFHEAQDTEDIPKMLVAADRLAGLGEQNLARYLTHVALHMATPGASATAGVVPRPKVGDPKQALTDSARPPAAADPPPKRSGPKA